MTSRTGVIAGGSGSLPDDMLLDKYKVSNVEFDPDEYDKFARRTLADFRPDAPFLESDQPRDPSDRGSGTLSTMRISLRENGWRAEESPWLEEGQFLDHHALERDPRGVNNEPDFNEYKRQSIARAPYIKFYKDDDFSVPESGINPVRMVEMRRQSQGFLAKRMTNFDESKESWHNGGIKRGGLTSRVVFQTNSGAILDLAEATAKNRQDLVDRASNALPSVLRWSGPDHRIKIASYSDIRPMIDIKETNYSANREKAELDHARNKQINGDMKNKFMALLITDLEGMRQNKQLVTHGAVYGDSEVQQTRQANQKLNPEDIYKLIQISAPLPENATFDDAKNRSKMTNGDFRVALSSTKMNHEIVESINSAVRKRVDLKTGDLREQIAQSAADYGLYNDSSNRKNGDLPAPTQNRHGLDTQFKEESKTIRNFAHIKPMTYHPTIDRTKFEDLRNDSWQGTQPGRTSKKTGKAATRENFEHTAPIFQFNDAPAKYAMDRQARGRAQVSVNDIVNKQSKNNNATNTLANLKQKVLDQF